MTDTTSEVATTQAETTVTATPTAEPSKPAKPESRRDSILAAVNAKEQAPVVKPGEKTPEGRDDKGRFAKSEIKPEPVKTEVKAEKQKRNFPNTWRKELRTHYDTLPDEVIAEIERRENDITSGFKDIAHIKREHDEMDKAVRPYLPTIRALNMTPSQAIEKLLNADHVLRTVDNASKARYLLQLAKNYGIPLESLQGANNTPTEISALQEQVAQLNRALQASQQQFQQAQQQSQYEPYLNEVRRMQAEKPDFQDLAPVMATLIENGKASDLDSAYELAKRTLNPEADLEAQRQKWIEDYKREELATAAAKQVRGNPALQPPQVNVKDRRAVIAAAIQNVGR
jgi:hypothetical protein